MKARVEIPNTLVDKIEAIHRKWSKWQTMEQQSQTDFPRLSIEDIKYLTLGTYQIKQALKYTREHVSKTGNYEFQVCQDIDKPGLCRARI